jgi:hypothetical protein
MRVLPFDPRIVASGVAAALGLFGAPVRAADVGSERPPALIVVEGARNVSQHSFPGDPEKIHIRYETRTPYPATVLIDEIRTKLEKSGWKALPRESISAVYPSGLRVGWRNHVNATPPPATQSFIWNAQWRDADGDVVAYTLLYLSPTVSPEGRTPNPGTEELNVTAILEKKPLLPVDGLPPSLIVLDGAKDVGAWRLSGEQRLGYDLTAPRPPSDAMTGIAERLEKQGWQPIAEPAPPFFPEEKWAKTHKTGWNFGTSGGFGGHLEWRATWRNESGSTVRYMLTYAGALSAGTREDPEHGVTNYYIQAEFNPTGRAKVVVFPPSGTPSVRRAPSP